MSSFFRELKQRKVYRVAVGYAVVAWLVVQISATVIPLTTRRTGFCRFLSLQWRLVSQWRSCSPGFLT